MLVVLGVFTKQLLFFFTKQLSFTKQLRLRASDGRYILRRMAPFNKIRNVPEEPKNQLELGARKT